MSNLCIPFCCKVAEDVFQCLLPSSPQTVQHKYETIWPSWSHSCHQVPVAVVLTDGKYEEVLAEQVDFLGPTSHPHVSLCLCIQTLVFLKHILQCYL